MKSILVLFALLAPAFASAHSLVSCKSGSPVNELAMTFSTDSSLLAEKSKVRIRSVGMLRLTYEALAVRNDAESTPEQLVLDLTTLKSGTDEVDPDGITARLALNVRSNGFDPVVVLPEGTGELKILKKPDSVSPRIRPLYVLSECGGLL